MNRQPKMSYIIVSAVKTQQLADVVNKLIAQQGYEPLGPMTFGFEKQKAVDGKVREMRFFQAMTKENRIVLT